MTTDTPRVLLLRLRVDEGRKEARFWKSMNTMGIAAYARLE